MYFVSTAKKMICSSIFTPILPRFFSSNPDLKTPSFIVNDYLASTFGFSPAKAAAISKRITHLKSPHNPDAVRSFLHHQGFSEAQIKTVITKQPSILCSSPQNNLGPNLLALRNTGLSASALTQIILSAPVALQINSAVPRIFFWRNFVGGDEALLVRVFKRNRGLIGHDTNGGIANKFLLLRSHGISIDDIQWIVCTVPCFITSSVSLIKDLLERTKEFGFQPESKMFAHGLLVTGSATREAVKKKMELLKSLGWSEDEFLTAVRKTPTMLCLSEKNLRAKMDFLLEEAKCDLSYITFRPWLLTLSLENRLRPRNNVLSLLESKDLSNKIKEFSTAILLSKSKFMERYIVPHKDKIPELYEVYLATCSSGCR